MNTLSYKTLSATPDNIQKNWVLVDAEGQTLGRLSSKVANLIRGKYKTNFTPNLDCGDYVIVINAEKIKLTGKKMTEKVYVRHTGYPGGQRFATPWELMQKFPERIIEHAVRGMLPSNKLGDALYRNLKVYAGTEHPHQAQQPQLINLNSIK
ncbi:MAG: large subunit ribosomal protein [Bacteroidetes bacterium]|jgi:large subunit ribosomal protein L13|nr:MAG: large subunit ribosomal protein [Bacteroidota bacterium]